MKLLEREGPLRDLEDLAIRATTGEGGVALIRGEAGIGKTSLLRAFTSSQAGRARILWGGCDPLFTPQPLGPVVEICRQLERRTLDGLTDLPREELFHVVLDEISSEPSILVLEDIHWADDATLDLCRFIGRRIQDRPLLLVTSWRDEETPQHERVRIALADVPADRVERIDLHPLSAKAVQSLVRSTRKSAKEILEITGGNPFFVSELVAADVAGVPPTLKDAVLARIARLSEPAREVAEVVAIFPERVERNVLERMGIDYSPADECVATGTLVIDRDRLYYRHEIARRAVEESLLPMRRETLHRDALRALRQLTSSEGDFGRLVHHASLAAEAGVVLELAPKAAEEATRLGAHREAASHYALALLHADSLDASSRATLLERYAWELYVTGRAEEAIVARLRAAELRQQTGERLREGAQYRWLSRMSWYLGRNHEARRHAHRAIEILEALPPSRELAMAYSNLAQLHMLASELEPTRMMGRLALRFAREVDDPATVAHALTNVGTVELLSEMESGPRQLKEALQIALEHRMHDHAARAYTNLGSVSAKVAHFEDAIHYLEEGLAYCRERDLDAWTFYMLGWRARVHLTLGRWSEAADDAHEVLRRTAVPPVARIMAMVVLGLLRSRRAEPGAEELLDEALDLSRQTAEIQRLGPVAAAKAESSWLAGTPESAHEVLRDVYALALEVDDPWLKGELACWAVRTGIVDRSGVPEVPGPWALEISGDHRGAMDAWEKLGCPYEAAVAGSFSGTERTLRRALDLADPLAVEPLTSRIRRSLRSLGARSVPRGARKSTRENPAGLSNRQMEVLALLTEGLRNKEIAERLFVSEKTIDHHVSAILAKLEVKTRTEAAAVARERGIAG